MIIKTLEALGIPRNTALAYQRLLELGEASARQLAENMDIPRPSIYDHLRVLKQKDLIVEIEKDNKKLFRIDDPANLDRLLAISIEKLQQQRKIVKEALPSLQKKTLSSEPRIKIYSGKDGVEQVLYDLMWYKNTEILSMWPFKEMANVLGAEYLAKFHEKRIGNRNKIRSLWPANHRNLKFEEYPFFGTGKKHLRELRLAPASMQWQMGHAIYEDKVSFIASHKELFGFIVQSRDFAELMRSQFEAIWELAKPLQVNEKYSKKFLTETYSS